MYLLRAWIGLIIFFFLRPPRQLVGRTEVRFNLLTLPSTRQADLRLALPARLNYDQAPLRNA